MFKSKIRPVIVPQYEHERLAGALAAAWGNADFDRPAFDFDAFIQGVALHDWHYGVIDQLSIGDSDEAAWLQIVRKGVAHRFENPITDIVAKLHIRRLLSHNDSQEASELIQQIDERIASEVPQTGYSRAQFEWADAITRCCDSLAFDFSFEKPLTDRVKVFARVGSTEETILTYEVLPGGEVHVDPWPFAVDSLFGILVSYQQAGYPERLVPEVIAYRVRSFRN